MYRQVWIGLDEISDLAVIFGRGIVEDQYLIHDTFNARLFAQVYQQFQQVRRAVVGDDEY